MKLFHTLLSASFLVFGADQIFLRHTHAQAKPDPVTVDIRETLQALLRDEDTDDDKKITIDDSPIPGTERGNKIFLLSTSSSRFEITGTYYLSNLLQELKLAEESGSDRAVISPGKIFEPPSERISRMIREYYWDGLTRRIDEEGLVKILQDEKTTTGSGDRYLYVPSNDALAYRYYNSISRSHPELRMNVVQLPEKVTPRFVRKLDGRHGIISLAFDNKAEGLPFVVPGGRFNEMYGWDSYFITLGLLQDGKTELAKSMVDNFIYEIEQYGKILNANRTYYLTRSQPPFFTSMVRAVIGHLPKNNETKEWLTRALNAAIKEYNTVWMNADRLTSTGLSRYFDSGFGQPPETEPGHFDAVYERFVKRYPMTMALFEQSYTNGSLKVKELDDYFVHDRAMRESGHDTSYRLEGRCADLVTVDLNSLLYKIETDIASIINSRYRGTFKTEGGSVERGAHWEQKASQRRERIDNYLWNGQRGMYFDYDLTKRDQAVYVSATTFYPLWAKAASKEQAESLVKNALPLLEMSGGIAGSTEESRGPISASRPPRQWDYPNGWAPHQMIVWQGLMNYGYTKEAERLAYRWLYTITSNAVNYNGTVPEKFDVTTRSHQVFAEYGNVGTKFSYITREGFGWTNASYQIGLTLLSKDLTDKLNRLVPPEWIF